jgi:hypothetical protein
MNTRITTSMMALMCLSLGTLLVPVQAAPAGKPSRIEVHEQRETPGKAPQEARGRTHPVKNTSAPSRGSTPPVAQAQGGRAQGGRGDRSGGQNRQDDRSNYARSDRGHDDRGVRQPARPPAHYQPDRNHDGGSRYRYDSSRYHHASAQHRYAPPRAVHHRYPPRRYYYPPRGYVAPVLPANVVVVRHRHYNYWYGGGIWYRSYGARYLVVAPPLGVFVSVLPSFHSTFWYGGIPYYYANNGYYVWRESQRAYEVVPPPAGAETVATDPVTEDLFVYPREGQGEEQVAFDRYECHRWASDATGFDPTQSWGGVAEDQAGALRQAYLRAMTACLEGRGYTVR